MTKSVQNLVRRYYCGTLDSLSLAGLSACECATFETLILNKTRYTLRYMAVLAYNQINVNAMSFKGNNFMSVAGFYLSGVYYGALAMTEAKHIFRRIMYKKDYAVQMIAESNRLLIKRAVYLIILVPIVIFKASKAFFVYHQDDIAINLIIYNLLGAGVFAILTFSLDIAYIKELSECHSDPVQNDLESKTGPNVIEKIEETQLNLQTPSDITKSMP
ncbi:hypothetical protein E3Q12_02776 [Wallemia mellicola]|nr:hypothetical protein E3Q12_02776 [Wallemia mellicola]